MRKILIVLFALISYTLNAQVYERTVTAKDTLKTKGAFVYQGANVPVPYGAYVMWSTSGTGSPITNPSQWHKTWVAGDKYLSFSSDYRLTWSRSILVGELSETDPVVRALSGIIKGTGVNITVATPNIDYLLPNAPITGATHTKITYDSKGLVVTGTDISTSDVPEGSRLYYTDARVSNNPTVLQALSAQHLHANKSALDVVSGYNSGDENRTSILTKLGAAYSGADGYLKKEDWVTFNGKQDALVGTGLVRSTNGVITYDTNNYLTSLSGAVLTNQVFGQVIGDNANRLHHLYTDSLDVTTTIVGSITGHAGSAENSNLLDGYHYTHFADSLHKHSVLYQPNGSNGFVYTDNSGQLHIDGNIIQSGSSYTTHAEQIYTNDDYIILRANASAGLGANEYAGFEAVKFDGVNNGRFVFDNTGLARVGTVGSERAIAVRIESPTDGYIATWDNANKRLDFIARTTFQAADADLAAIAAFTGTGLARRTGSGTWTLDTNSYLTSLTGALLLDQSTPQSVTGGAPIFYGVRLNTSGALTPVTGMFFWNATEKTASLQLADGGSYELGQELGDYYKNVGATTMINGDIVSIAATPGNSMAIELTDPTSEVSSRNCIGMVTVASIAPNGTGRVTKIGKVRGLNTDSYTEGDAVYVNPAQPGKLTATMPDAPNHVIKVGSVDVKSQNNGVIDLTIRSTPDFAQLSDVNGTALTTSGQIAVWDNTHKYFDFTKNINDYATSADLTTHANLTTTAHGLGASAFHADSFFAPASGSGNYIQNQNSSAQSANAWIEGVFKVSSGSNNATFANNYLRAYISGSYYFDHGTVGQSFIFRTSNSSSLDINALTIASTGAATFSSTVRNDGWYYGTSGQQLIRGRSMGYSVSYAGLQVGNTGDHIALFIDPTSVTGGSFDGGTNEIAVPNSIYFIQANPSGTNWMTSTLSMVNGSVGVDTTNPYGTLAIGGSDPNINIGGSNTKGWLFQQVDANNRFRIYEQNTGSTSERFTILSGGNAGINEPEPNVPLHVTNSGGNQFILEDSSAGTDLKKWLFTSEGGVLKFKLANDAFNSSQTFITILSSGNSGFQVSSPTAKVHIAAGTATASTAPLKFTSGTLLTTPEAGAMEFNTNSLYITGTSGTRRELLVNPVNDQWFTSYDYAGNLMNVWKVSKDNTIVFNYPVELNAFYHVANSGFNDIVSIPVDSRSPDNTVHGVGFTIGNTRVLSLSMQSDGAGGTDTGALTMLGKTSTTTFQMTYGAVNGYTLHTDGSGNAYWAAATVPYKGTWNAATNSPSISDGSGSAGDWYRTATAGTWNSITFAVGDDVYYNGSVWQKIAGVGYTLQIASGSVLGGVKIGSGVSIDGNGVISVSTAYDPSGTTATHAALTTSAHGLGASAFHADSYFMQPNASITGATKTKITYDSRGLVTAGADATTADIAASTNKNYVTDAQLTVIGNTSGTNSGDNAVNSLYSSLVTNQTHTGDATGSTALTLATVNSNIGTYTKITINAKGLATAGAAATTSDIAEGTNLYYTENRVAANSAVVANTAKVSNATHTGDVTGATALTISSQAVTYAKIQNMGSYRILGRITANSGSIEELTAANVGTILGLGAAAYVGLGTSSTQAAYGDHLHTGVYQPLMAVLTNTTASFTTALESKLNGIAAGAEVNVNADWNAVSGDAFILNKPTIPTTTGELSNTAGFITTSALSGYSLTSHNHAFDNLSNVTITSKLTGDLIKWNGSAWVNFTPSYTTLTEVANVGYITSDVKWNGGSAGLVAATGRTSLGLGTAAVANLGTGASDAAYGNHNHSGTYMPYVSTNTAYNLALGTTGGTVAEGNHNHNLDNLANVSTTGKAAGDLLSWNGTYWVKLTPPYLVASDLNGYATQTWVTNTALSGYATQSWVNGRGFLTSDVYWSGTAVGLNAATGRASLGLGTAAQYNYGDFVAYRTFGTAANSAVGDFATAGHDHDTRYLRKDQSDTSSGTITAQNFILSSDRRLKENIVELLPRDPGVTYYNFNMINDSTKRQRSGAIAQEVQANNPELVYTDQNGNLSVAYIDLFVKEIVALKARVKYLESKYENK